MTLTARIALLVAAVLVLNTVLVLVISKDRTRTAFRNQARAALETALDAAERELEDIARELAKAVDEIAGDVDLIARLEEAAAGLTDRESNDVVRSADRARRALDVDLLRILDARGVVLSSSPDLERFGTPDRALAALATLPTERAEVREVPFGEGTATVLLRVRRTPAGLVIACGRRVDEELTRTLSRQVGADVLVRRPGVGEWTSAGGSVPRIPASADTIRSGEIRLIEAGDVTAGEATVLDGHLELLVMREDATLGELESRLTRSVLIVGAITLLITLAVAFLLTRTISGPLTALTRATVRVAAGDWDHRVHMTGGASEFRSLVSAFNTMQGDLARQRGALQRAERVAAWQDAARRVAHEIKNTLMPLQLAWERLSGGGREASVTESTDAIAAEITNLRRLVTEFSELGQWPEPVKRRVDLSDVAKRTAGVYGVSATALADEGVAVAEADAGQIARALSNLLQNALDAAGPEGKVTIRTWRDAKGAALSVTDDGPGMDEQTMSQIFTPYFTRKPGGTGLGLSIVERIAEANGASCGVKSAPGEGTCVTLRFASTPVREES